MTGPHALPSPAMLDLNLQLMKLLAVAGGAALGYVVLGGLLRFLGRFVFRKQLPRPADVGVRLLGAATCGLLVWLWLFGVGGPGGWGGTGGWLPGGGPGGGGQPSGDTKGKAPEPAPPARGEALQVELLGGDDVKEQRFYRIEGESQALTFADLTRAIAERRAKQPSLAVLRIVLRENSVDSNNPAVTQLKKWARESGLTPEEAAP